jgi:hypothetical protein
MPYVNCHTKQWNLHILIGYEKFSLWYVAVISRFKLTVMIVFFL